MAFAAFLPQEQARSKDELAIRTVLQRAYVEGVFNKRDPDIVREGFAPTFVFQRYWDGELSSSKLSQWLEKMKLDRVPSTRPVEAKIKILDLTGDAAITRLDMYQDAQHTYTDYFGLYRTKKGWKIVSKMFHAHR